MNFCAANPFEDKLEETSGAKSKASTAVSSSSVKGVSNKVYFYSNVSDKSVLSLQEEMDKVTTQLMTQSYANRCDPAPIYIHINSFGGDLLAGFAAIDIIERCQLKTISVVEGKAASAATLMSLAADERLMTPHSFMLIHQLSGQSWGDFEKLKDQQNNREVYMQMLLDFYQSKTKISRRGLEETLKHDLYFGAEKCKTLGLVDGIYRG